jgi:glycosyltransferase involved in cell wall biosynthesis
LKILQINNIHYRRGGADIVYLNTGKLLENHGHDVLYFSQKNDKNETTNSNDYFIKETNYFDKSLINKIYSIPRFFYSDESKRQLSKLINELKPDLAHIHLYKGTLTPSILEVLKINKVPIIISLHDYGLLCPHNLMLDGKMNICTRCVSGSALNCISNKCNRNNLLLSTISSLEYIFHKAFFPFDKYFDKIIAVSKFGQQMHQKSKGLFDKIVHLYNFYPNMNQTKINSNKGNYILYFGRLSAEKGIKTLFSAWLQQKRKSKLKVVGTGDLFNELNSISTKNDSIEMLGFKSGEELNSLIREASFIIVPSEWYENNPLTIIEAYANGKPVIGSNVGGIPEIINDGITGLLFEMGSVKDLSEKITKAEAINEQDYYRLSTNARKFADEYFSEESHYSSLLSIYEEVIESKKLENKIIKKS